MKVNSLLLYSPSAGETLYLKIVAVVTVILIACLHYAAGPLFEFHLFFFIPIVIASWFTNKYFSYFIISLVIISWTLGDYLIASETLLPIAFFFNALMHAFILIYVNHLLTYIRTLLQKEAQMAREDALTQILNRRGFFEYGETAISTANRYKLPVTIIFIDLDEFKSINDTLGHKIGDQLLYQTAKVLKENIRKSDVAGRLGGDEFCLVLLNINSSQALEFSENLRNRLKECMNHHNWNTTFSMGIVSYNTVPDDFQEIIQEADKLMYQVKNKGRNGFLHSSYP